MKKKMKKVICVILSVVTILSISIPVFAVDTNVPYYKQISAIDIDVSNPIDTLNGSIQTRSVDLPTAYHNLAVSNYTANLQYVGKNWLYTNVKYHANGTGDLYCVYNVKAKESATQIFVGLYDLTKDELIIETIGYDVSTGGNALGIHFGNLNPSHMYAVCFRAHPSALTGTAVIKHRK